MTTYSVGQSVKLNTKTYKIVGTIKRSFLLECDGKQYKMTGKAMDKCKAHNKKGVGTGKRTQKSSTFYMNRRVDWLKIFDKKAGFPKTEKQLLSHLERIACDLSPENLHCDGEISVTAARLKARELNKEWKEVENLLGRKVSESEIYNLTSC